MKLVNAQPIADTIEMRCTELVRQREFIVKLDTRIIQQVAGSTGNTDQEISNSSDKIMKIDFTISKAKKCLATTDIIEQSR